MAWCVLAGMVLLLLFSNAAMQAALGAAQVFAQGVLPALLPMMVLCRLLPKSSKSEHSVHWQAVAFAWAAGSPAAAQRVEALWRAGRVAPGRVEALLCLTGVMSPLFFTGTLAVWTGSPARAWAMLLAHWLGALLTAGLWGRWARPAPAAGDPIPGEEAPCSLPGAIAQSARALLCVCGAMMLFSTAAGILTALLGRAAPHWTAAHARALAVGWALLEIGSGARAVLDAFAQPPWALLCGLCSFGGCSLWLQNLLFVGQCIRPAKLLCMRALHGAVGYVLCYFFLKIQNLLIT